MAERNKEEDGLGLGSEQKGRLARGKKDPDKKPSLKQRLLLTIRETNGIVSIHNKIPLGRVKLHFSPQIASTTSGK